MKSNSRTFCKPGGGHRADVWTETVPAKPGRMVVMRPVGQLYGQELTDWNQCFVIDWSLSHPAGHKPFTCSHSVLRNTWLNIHAVRWRRFSTRLSVHVFTTSRNLTWSFFISSAVSELSSDWFINSFLRYVCFCIVMKDKSLFVLMVDRCCPFCVFKTCAELEAINCSVSPLNSPVCFVSQTTASLSNAFTTA